MTDYRETMRLALEMKRGLEKQWNAKAAKVGKSHRRARGKGTRRRANLAIEYDPKEEDSHEDL